MTGEYSLTLSSETLQTIVDLLYPLMQDEISRRPLIVQAFGTGSPFLRRITWSGNANDFANNLVLLLVGHGEVEPGKQALWELMKTVRGMVGVDKQRRIDNLRSVINAVPVTSTPSPVPSEIQKQSTDKRGNDMDYLRGLEALKKYTEGTDWEKKFTVQEIALRENLNDEDTFGPSEQSRRDRLRIAAQLNRLSSDYLGTSFADLCLGKQPSTVAPAASEQQEIIERLLRIEGKIDTGREEDRLIAAQILAALEQNRIEQGEATKIATELQAWAQEVKETGLPSDPELREKVDALTDHSAGAYQYLQLAVPIIPGILSYNVELGSDHQVDLKTIWGRIKARLKGKSKG